VRDELDLGCTPSDEDCAQVGEDNYSARARAECKAYIGQLERQLLGTPRGGLTLRVKSNAHDYGSYYSVVACFDEEDEAAQRAAYRLENEQPHEWDAIAREELGLNYTPVWQCPKCERRFERNEQGYQRITKRVGPRRREDWEEVRGDWQGGPSEDAPDGLLWCDDCVMDYTVCCDQCGQRCTDEAINSVTVQDEVANVCSDDCAEQTKERMLQTAWESGGLSASLDLMLEHLFWLTEYSAGDLPAEDEELVRQWARDTHCVEMLRAYFDDHEGALPRHLEPEGKAYFSGNEWEEWRGHVNGMRCPECGFVMIALHRMRTTAGLKALVPTVSDDTSWRELKDDHAGGCQWLASRAWRKVPDEGEGEGV
jgi:hypothetical protein